MLQDGQSGSPESMEQQPKLRWLTTVAAIAGVALLYYIAARAGLPMSFGKSNSTPIWFPAGIGLAGMLLWGRLVGIGIWVAAFAANMIVFRQNHAAQQFTILWLSAAIATGNTLAALVGQKLYCHWLGCNGEGRVWARERRPMLFRKTNIFKFLFAALATAAASAAVGPAAVCLARVVPWGNYPLILLNWCIGDAFGIITATPFLVAVAWSVGIRWDLSIWAKITASFVALGAICYFVFAKGIHFDGRGASLLFLPFVALVWIALRLGPRLAAAAVLFISAVATWNTYYGHGPLILDTPPHSFIFLNAYLWVIALTGLALEALESDVIALKQAQDVIHKRNESLRFLSDCLAQLLSQRSTDEIVSNFLPKIASHIGPGAILRLFTVPAINRNDTNAAAGSSADTLCEICRTCPDAFCCSAAQSRSTVIVNNIQLSGDPQLDHLRSSGAQCCLCIPLLAGDRLLGVLSCIQQRKAKFDSSEITLLQLVSGYIAIAIDRARASEIINERQQRLQIALEIANMGTWELNISEKIHSPPTDEELRTILDAGHASPELEHMMGLPRGAYCGAQDWEHCIHPDDRTRTLEAYRHAVDGIQPLDIEHRFIWPDGIVHWAHCCGKLLPATRNMPPRIIGVSVDITHHKQAEEAIRHRNERLQLISDYLEQLLCERDPDKIVTGLFKQVASHVQADSAFYYHVNFEARELTLHAAIGISEEIRRGIARFRFGEGPIGKAAETRTPVVITGIQHSRDPTLAFLQETGFQAYIGIPLITGDRLMGVLCFASRGKTEFTAEDHDFLHLISGYAAIALDRAEAESATVKAKQAAEDANSAKDLFIAALSHELRTPLTPALMTTSALEQDESLPLPIRERMGAVRGSIEMEARLIDDLLDLTRIEHGKLMLRLEQVDIHSVLARSMEFARDEIARKHQVLQLKTEATRFVTQADPARLQQVFWNLISNAIKFTPPGGRIEICTFNSGADSICIEVKDTGIGIAAEELSRIFSPFEQGTAAGRQRSSGLGLGLAISKSIVELHHGAIAATSSGRHQGACFIVRLPITVPKEVSLGQPSEPPSKHLSHLNILLVEDNEEIRSVLTRVLVRDGHAVHAESTCAAALEAARTQPGPFQVLISDIGLPDGSGLTLVRQIKANAPELTAIAVSGYGTREDVERSMQAGFSAHLTKPINIQDLRRAIAA